MGGMVLTIGRSARHHTTRRSPPMPISLELIASALLFLPSLLG
jgi:hypothetical protein